MPTLSTRFNLYESARRAHRSAYSALAAITAMCLFDGSLWAQGTLAGQVRADSSRAPIPGVEVLVEKTNHHTQTDSQGQFVLNGLPAKRYVVLLRAIGWTPVRMSVTVSRTDTTRIDVLMLANVPRLEPVTVTEAPKRPRGRGFEGIEERRKLGAGKFIDSADLQRHENRHLADLLRAMPGVTIRVPPFCRRFQTRDCVTDRTTEIAVSGRIMGKKCLVEVVLDGIVVSEGGSNTPWENAYDLGMLRVSEIAAVEIYRSAGEIPAEFNSGTAACGVLVIWTKRAIP